ncbi:hypothetical protein D9C73_028356 [Collichthys lucidus]|uniref:Uncharacterized protein n=1 Tax=Collichthys lucidus TaxID=240159 RepID=A0A4U5TW72_COLLU|nr:hypothetical protein D9C73_028356 [Collichthys lucidus]
MATNAGFYVTLPSNASKDVFKNNTSSNYTVDLAKAIELNGEWEVGLCEIIYPHTWYTLPRDNAYIELMEISDEAVMPSEKDDPNHTKPGELLIIQKFSRGGYYDKPKDLLDQIVPKLIKYDPTAEAVYNNVTKCIDFKGSGRYKIRAQAPLAYMLGLKPDIIQYQPIGDSYSPLLSVVNVKGGFGDVLSIEDKVYTEILPLSAITDGGHIEFFIPGDGEKYLDLNDTLLHLRLKITNADGTDLANDAAVGLINYPLNTMFSQCDVILGDRLISQSSATHPYRAMIETLLNYSEDTLKSQFSAGLFYKDTAGALDSIVTNNGPNRGLNSRAAFSANSREIHLFGPLHGDVFFCERLLLNSVDMRIKLTRASDAFCLMGARDSLFRLRILGASLFVKKVTVSPAIRLGHAAALLRGNALYPLSRVNVKTYSIPANSRICNQENLFLGAMPKYVVLGMVHHEAFTGRRDLSPFNFVHNNVEYLALCQDGRQVPAKAFQPQFNQGSSVREFYNMFIATGRHLKDLPLSINREEFNDGYSLFVFNLTPGDDNDALSPVSNGNLRLEMRFRVALPHTTTLIVYACYDSILEINSKRQVLVDYY